jgi:hypothetical protein
MIVNTVSASTLREAWRLDARFYSAEGNDGYLRVHSGRWPTERLKDIVSADKIWAPARFGRVYAADERYGKPYLAPSDTLRYMPRSDAFLSRSQTRSFDSYELERGWVLITCSGRNLGPTVWVDGYLERFVASHDMIRVTSSTEDKLFFVLAYLHTPTGQQVIRRDRNGSVIDHIGPAEVRDLLVPLVDDALMQTCTQRFQEASLLRERARLALDRSRTAFLEMTGRAEHSLPRRSADARRRFETDFSALRWRLDAEPYAPIYEEYRRAIAASGSGHSLADVAEVTRPRGRYTTIYVEDQRHGLPLLSGRQIAQYRPVALKHISPRAFDDPDSYRLEEGWLVMTADGRAEENLADCAVVASERAGWTASGHVHRIKPNPDTHIGLLYLACTDDMVQAIIKAQATGSVVDALSEADLRQVPVPLPSGHAATELGDTVWSAWQDFSAATKLEEEASSALERELAS